MKRSPSHLLSFFISFFHSFFPSFSHSFFLSLRKTKLNETKVAAERCWYIAGGGVVMPWPVRFQCVWFGISVDSLLFMYVCSWLYALLTVTSDLARSSGTWHLCKDGESVSCRMDGDIRTDFRQPLSASCVCPSVFCGVIILSGHCRLSPSVFQLARVGSTLISCVLQIIFDLYSLFLIAVL
jgi:hypothetical protein